MTGQYTSLVGDLHSRRTTVTHRGSCAQRLTYGHRHGDFAAGLPRRPISPDEERQSPAFVPTPPRAGRGGVSVTMSVSGHCHTPEVQGDARHAFAVTRRVHLRSRDDGTGG